MYNAYLVVLYPHPAPAFHLSIVNEDNSYVILNEEILERLADSCVLNFSQISVNHSFRLMQYLNGYIPYTALPFPAFRVIVKLLGKNEFCVEKVFYVDEPYSDGWQLM